MYSLKECALLYNKDQHVLFTSVTRKLELVSVLIKRSLRHKYVGSISCMSKFGNVRINTLMLNDTSLSVVSRTFPKTSR